VIVRLLLFASAREAAGRSHDEFELIPGAPLERLLADAVERYGTSFATVLATARVWVNGDEPGADGATPLHDDDEIAVLPPVSGGAGAAAMPHTRKDTTGPHAGGSLRVTTGRVGAPTDS
jgi:molybdopterin converting factor small subunit